MPNQFGLRGAHEPRPPVPPIDTNTTAGIFKAISNRRWQHKMPMSSSISLPVPIRTEDGVIILSFFLYLCSGPANDKKILPPFCRTGVYFGQAEETIEFIPIEPQDLDINISPVTELGCIHRDLSHRLDEGESKKRYQENHEQRNKFYEAVDYLAKIYPPVTLSFSDRYFIKTYRDYFYAQEEVEFLLPAYKALNPNFIDWMDVKGKWNSID
jgi:hypothetical protein